MSTIRTQVSGEAADLIIRLAEQHGLDVSELASTAIEAALARSHAATTFLETAKADELLPSTTQAEFSAGLEAVTSGIVTAIRLSSRDSDGAQEEPWPRDYGGCDLDETDLAVLWASTRGWWVISHHTDMLVAYRVGNPKAVFVVTRWSQRDDRRRYAVSGFAIVGARRVDPETGNDIGPASEVETSVGAFVMGRRLVMPRGAQNPLAVLHG